MNIAIHLLALLFGGMLLSPEPARRVFDVHLHGSENVSQQLADLEKAGVYRTALSSSWELQNSYRGRTNIQVLYGLMFPCPEGKVPYSRQGCFEDGKAWPGPAWVEQQIRAGRIDFLGEVLSQYYGISSSDSTLYPYYSLAEKYQLPVGVHTGGAGPGHGSPDYQEELGNPELLRPMLRRFPKVKVWIMHGGDQFFKESIALMKEYPGVYTDLSVLTNPQIVPQERFETIMKAFIQAGLTDRLMFGSDNGDIAKCIASIKELPFLSDSDRRKIFYLNAEVFFRKGE